MDIASILRRAVALYPGSEAVVDGERRLTYADVGARVGRLATALMARGIVAGDVVAIIAPNCLEFLETYFACAYLGAVVNPINCRLAPREMAYIIQDSTAEVVICHQRFADVSVQALQPCTHVTHVLWIGGNGQEGGLVESSEYERALTEAGEGCHRHENLAHDVAHLYYTSGTTGKAKGVMLTQENVTFHALTAIAELKLSDADTWAHVAPMFHLADAWATFAITWVGGRHVFCPQFRASDVLSLIEREGVTITNLIPTMLNAMVNDPDAGRFDVSSLRVLLSGGAPIAPETVRKIVATFKCDYIQTYGMTETSPYLTLSVLKEHLKSLPEDRQLAVKSRTGRPFAAVDLKVVRPSGEPVRPDDSEVGEIIVRGPTVTPGYWKQPAETARAIRDGWLYTGDLAVVDGEGYVNIVDRKKDMIITGGENVYSTEVEHVLYEHHAVLECAVIGLPDPDWGETVQAAVVLRPGSAASAAELIEFSRQRLAAYKCPRAIEFLAELPKTGSGKIMKSEIRQTLLNQSGDR